MKRHRLLWAAVLTVCAAFWATGAVMADEADLSALLSGAQAHLGKGDTAAGWAACRDILKAAAAMEAEALTGADHQAVAMAHYYLAAEAADKAIAAGGLDEETAAKLAEFRDEILASVQKSIKVIGFGEKIDLAAHLVPGKTNLVDFYSDYCPPCVRIAPYLDELAQARDDLVVIKVDINRPGVQGIDWQSPVAQQFKLNSIPHFKIYGPEGALVSEGTEAAQTLSGWLQ